MHELGSRRRSRLSAGTGKIALTLGLCLCAGQLVATPAVAAPTAVAPATTVAATTTATLAAAVNPRLNLTANKKSVASGSRVLLTAKLIDPRTGKGVKKATVRLQAWRNGAWRTWQTKKTPTSGAVAFGPKPGSTVSYRTVSSAATGIKSGTSKQIKVTVVAAGNRIIAEAAKHKGARYVFGASGPRTFDCSGYTMYVYRKSIGKKLPHKANLQQRYGKAVSKSSARPGDLLVFRSGSYGTHVGIYAGGGAMWASPRAGKTVKKQKLYSKNYVVRRLV